MLGGLVHRMRKISCESRLRVADNEQVGESMRMNPVQRSHTIGPFLFEAYTIPSNDVIASSPSVACTDFESCGKNNAVDLVLYSVGHHAFFRNPFHAFTICIN